MTKNTQPHDKKPLEQEVEVIIGRKKQIAVLAIFCIIGAVTVAITVLSITMIPKDPNPGVQRGVGADGFRAGVEDGVSLNVKSIASKAQVVTALGRSARSVGDPQVSKVFNYNGNLGQTLTFPFVRIDGVTSSLYIDKRIYKDKKALDDDHIYIATMQAGKVNGLPLYFRHAQTIGNSREYHLMVIDGLTVYRFVVAQPDDNIYMSEVNSLAALKKIALAVKL